MITSIVPFSLDAATRVYPETPSSSAIVYFLKYLDRVSFELTNWPTPGSLSSWSAILWTCSCRLERSRLADSDSAWFAFKLAAVASADRFPKVAFVP